MAVIDHNDVATAIGRPISDASEQAQVTQWITDVEMLLGIRLGDLADIADQDALGYVVREAVIARMRFREDRNADSASTSDGNFFVTILDPWWALLTADEVVSPPAAYTVSLSGASDVEARY